MIKNKEKAIKNKRKMICVGCSLELEVSRYRCVDDFKYYCFKCRYPEKFKLKNGG